MKLAISMLVAFGLLIAYFVIIFQVLPSHGVAKYDCSIAEISPDIPPKVREECRKIRMQKNGP